MFRTKSKEEQLEKLETKKRNIINMIAYYETEIKDMNTLAKKASFQSEEHHTRYLENLKEKLLKQHDKLIDITTKIEELKNT